MAEFGIHIRNKILSVDEIVAVDVTQGVHHNVFHSHGDAYELIYCASGHMVVQIRDTWTDIDGGTAVLIPNNVMHNTVTETDNTICYYIAFIPGDDILDLCEQYVHLPSNIVSLFYEITPEISDGYINVGNHKDVRTLIPYSEMAPGAEQLILCTLEMLLVFILREVKKSDNRIESVSHDEKVDQVTNNPKKYIADQVKEYINDHITEKLSVEQIAAHFGYSRSRLSTLYKQVTGFGINDTINNEKLLRARQLLIESDMHVNEISEYLGFSSPQYFTNRFLLSTGMSPSNYARFKRTKVN
ncbi:MAG: AraC family transcriptional regulator [Eubacteriales bacterium]|nr:AraC family transcriptional regulator [Eubacteriales bacterium]